MRKPLWFLMIISESSWSAISMDTLIIIDVYKRQFGSLASPCLTVLSRRSVTLHNSALCFVVAAIAFKKQFGAFPAALSANLSLIHI